MERIEVGVIGAGRMGQNHCRVFSTLRQVDLVGVCDPLEAHGRRVARQYETEYYDSLDRMLDRVQAVSIAVPTPAHFDLALHCISRGVHVFVEKPITETLEQAIALVDAAERSKLVVQVGHIERFNPAYRELKNLIESIGALVIDIRRLSAYQGSNTDVDVVLDLMVHDTDLALDLTAQRPTAISGYGLRVFSNQIDHAVVHVRMESGLLLTMTASRVTEEKVRQIEVTAREAYVVADLLKKSVEARRRTFGEYLQRSGHAYRQESVIERLHVPGSEPLFLELEHFADCVQQDHPPLVPARDGMRALKFAMQIRDVVNDNLSIAGAEPQPVTSKTL
jgi:predicted dehydrogenase